MSEPTPQNTRLPTQPLPANIQSSQPGGGLGYRVELAWGTWRRWYLRNFRRNYVRRMAERRQGDPSGAPHEILDPRDLKFCRIVCTAHWRPEDDPFRWREKIPFARWGLAELQLFGLPLLALAALAGYWFWPLALVPAALLAIVVWFFRDPPRRVPGDPGLVVSPADGTVTEVTELPHDDYVGGPAVKIGIFLSLFNVHLNRAPLAARVIGLRYQPGQFLNAQRPESSLLNENMWIGLEEDAPPYRRIWLRQVSGLVARRIVCDARPGDVLARGQKLGMIKLGSRTELTLPTGPDLRVEAKVGQKLRAGTTVVARYLSDATSGV